MLEREKVGFYFRAVGAIRAPGDSPGPSEEERIKRLEEMTPEEIDALDQVVVDFVSKYQAGSEWLVQETFLSPDLVSDWITKVRPLFSKKSRK